MMHADEIVGRLCAGGGTRQQQYNSSTPPAVLERPVSSSHQQQVAADKCCTPFHVFFTSQQTLCDCTPGEIRLEQDSILLARLSWLLRCCGCSVLSSLGAKLSTRVCSFSVHPAAPPFRAQPHSREEKGQALAPPGKRMEYERALFRVYDKSMEGFHSPAVRSACNLLKKCFLVISAGLFATLVLLHHQFVNNPGMYVVL